MLEQAPVPAVIHPPECVSARGRLHPAGRARRGPRRLAPGTRACITALAAALLSLAPGCSLLLDFDVPPIDAAADAQPIDAPLDAGPIDAAPVDAQDGPRDAAGADATPPLVPGVR